MPFSTQNQAGSVSSSPSPQPPNSSPALGATQQQGGASPSAQSQTSQPVFHKVDGHDDLYTDEDGNFHLTEQGQEPTSKLSSKTLSSVASDPNDPSDQKELLAHGKITNLSQDPTSGDIEYKDENNQTKKINKKVLDDHLTKLRQSSPTSSIQSQGGAPSGSGGSPINPLASQKQPRRSNDQCSTSSQISSDFNCNTSDSRIDSAQSFSQMSMIMGGMSLSNSTSGTVSSLSSDSADAQKAALNAAAEVSRNAAIQSGVAGGIQAALAASLYGISKKHGMNAAKITKGANATLTDDSGDIDSKQAHDGTLTDEHQYGWVSGENDVQKKIIKNFQLNQNSGQSFTSQRDQKSTQEIQEGAKRQQQLVGNEAAQIGAEAASEQKEIQARAKSAMLQPTMMAISQFMSAKSSMDQMKSLQDQINQLGNTNSGVAIAPTTPTPTGGSTIGSQSGGNAILGSGLGATADPNPIPSSSEAANLTVPTLDTGLAPNVLNSDVPLLNPPGEVVAAHDPGGGGGGGGGGGEGGGGTPPGEAPPSEGGGPQSLLEPPSMGGYETTGGVAGRSKDGKGSDGPDLSALMNLLVKKDDPTIQTGGILEFDSKKPTEPVFSPLLGKEANLFKRVSSAIRDKETHGGL